MIFKVVEVGTSIFLKLLFLFGKGMQYLAIPCLLLSVIIGENDPRQGGAVLVISFIMFVIGLIFVKISQFFDWMKRGSII